MIRIWLAWLQNSLGKGSGADAQSWSEVLLGSLNAWSLLEGTHLLFLILFAGTIFVVDLRLLGLVFRRTPVSVISRAILPLTIIGFILMVATGLGLFFAKPLFYYHNIWFRGKLIFLAAATINIAVFHVYERRSQGAWDQKPLPPLPARLMAALSLASWLCVITLGRFIAYDWYECGKPIPHWANALQECKASEKGAVDRIVVPALKAQGA